jgi:polyketide synthase PksN
VVQQLQPWGSKKELSRKAGISSFGSGGTYAHALLEEYSADTASAIPVSGPYIFVLSAKNEERLKEYVKRIISYLETAEKVNCANFAYTLQVGRAGMDERLGTLFTTLDELKGKLVNFIEGNQAGQDLHLGQIKKHRELLATLDQDAGFRETVNQWISERQLLKLLDFWVKGLHIDWGKLYERNTPRRIALPTYPFAKEKYWIEEGGGATTALKRDEGLYSGQMAEVVLKANDQERVRYGTLLLHPVWKEKAIASQNTTKKISTHLFDLRSGSFEEVSLQLFAEVQKIIKSHPKEELLIQVVIDDPLKVGLSALLKTAHLEHPKIFGQVLLIKERNQPLEWLLEENRSSLEDQEILYEKGKRLVRTWEELKEISPLPRSPWKDHGVYLITGGAGALGLLFAKEIASKAAGATIILTGRSALSAEKEKKLEAIRALGSSVDYIQFNRKEQGAIDGLIKAIQKQYGTLNGVLHCAGVTRDSFFLKKTEEQFREVLHPKVADTIDLDQATRALALDFFVLFSSIVGAFGNIGQADYAAANGFMDSFAAVRNSQVACGERQGHTVSINWPYWQEGGMQLDDASIGLMKQIRLKKG